jgi:hypothetical protein
MSQIAWHHAKFTTDVELEMATASSIAMAKAADPAQLFEECAMAADEFVQVHKNTLGLQAPEPIEISRDSIRLKAKESYRQLFNDLSSAPAETLGTQKSLRGPKSVLDGAPDKLLENLIQVAVAKLVSKTGIDPNVTIMNDTIMPDMTAADFQVLLSETFTESLEPYQVDLKGDNSKNYKASGSADPTKPYPGNKGWKSGKGKGKGGKSKNTQRQVPWMKDWTTDKKDWSSEHKDWTKTTTVEDTKEPAKASAPMEEQPRFIPPPSWLKIDENEETKSGKRTKNPWLWDPSTEDWTNQYSSGSTEPRKMAKTE